MTLSVTFHGTRGSIPTPGPATARYGGNTPCIRLSSSTGEHLILDAGTGIRPLGQRLVADAAAGNVSVLLTHTHWDHIQGLPFFAPLHRGDWRVEIAGPDPAGTTLDAVLRSQMASPVFPVPAEAVAARMSVAALTLPAFEIGNFAVRSIPLCHPGVTLGYSIRHRAGGKAVTYMTDNELRSPAAVQSRAGFVRFLQGTEVLVHDAMYFEAEIGHRVGWGHSSAVDAVLLALEGGVDRLVLFHHDPGHDDGALEQLLAEALECRVRQGGTLDVTIAAEGHTIRCQEENG